MSMMMKLINAAAGQSVGDEVFFVQNTTNTFRLVKLDFDAGTFTYGPNKSDGTYGDGDIAGNNRHPESMGAGYAYTQNSNSTCIIGDDGYIYGCGYTNLSSSHSSAQGKTSILMRWNSRTLEPDPGFFYNIISRDTSTSSTRQDAPQEILYHAPSQTITMIGQVLNLSGTTAAAYTIKINPWPSSAIDVVSSGAYHSTSNPNGRHMGVILAPSSTPNQSISISTNSMGNYNTHNNSAQRLHLMSNGKDQLGATTMRGGQHLAGSHPMGWKVPYLQSASGSYGNFNVGGSNFTFETTSPENPFLEMTGYPLPWENQNQWKSRTNNHVGGGIVNIYYRPGKDNGGIYKTPGTYHVQTHDGYFFVFTEGSSKVESYPFGDGGSYSFSYKYTLLDNGCLVRRKLFNSSSTHSGAGISIIDLDYRTNIYGSNLGVVDTGKYATTFQHTPVVGSSNDERVPLTKNPNDKHLEKIVQTKSGRIFGIFEDETPQQLPPNGGSRMIEIFISEPDVNNFYRRSISYGDVKVFTLTPSYSVVGSGSQVTTLVGNMPTSKISTVNVTAAVTNRFTDTGNSFMQDTPTDAIYIRENTHLYAINPNTRSNITSYDFANQGASGHTNATNIDPSANPTWGGGISNAPTAKFSEGNGSTTTSLGNDTTSAQGGYGDVEGNTTYDLIYGDDSRLYMALKMDVKTRVATNTISWQDNEHALVRFHTGTDGTTIQCGERGPHPNPNSNIRNHPQGTSPSTANHVVTRDYYYYGTLNNHIQSSVQGSGAKATNIYGGNGGMFSGVNLMYDNKRKNVWIVGRRDLENCNNPDGRTNYSRMIAVPAGDLGPAFSSGGQHYDFDSWPSEGSLRHTEPVLSNLERSALYGQIGNAGTSQVLEMFEQNGGADSATNGDRVWMNSANYGSTDTPNGFERMGVISGQAINVTMNGRTADYSDTYDPNYPNRGAQIYFSGMSNDATQYNSSHATKPGTNTSGSTATNYAPIGENRIGAVPTKFQQNTVNNYLLEEPGYGYANRNHNTSVHSSQNPVGTTYHNNLYHARIKLKTNQSTAVTASNNEEGIRCVWYYKGAFHGVTTFNEGTYVYMPEPQHGNLRNGNNSSSNDNTNTVTHYVSQCESGQNTYNNVIGGSNTKIGTAEGCKNSDWAACVAPGGILCLPKQDSGYAKAGFIGINLGTKSILNTSSGSGQPFEAPSSVNPNNKQIKQMVVTSTGKIWAILDYENASASTLQFRILQVVFNSNYSSVTWSGGLYTSQASNSNSGHVKFYRTVCGNMPQSKMEWDAV